MNLRRRSAPAFIGGIAGALLLLFAARVDAQAAVALRWTKTYNGAYNGSDVGNDVAVAADGSIYVTGYTQVEWLSSSLLLRKYSPTGALLWTRTYRGASEGSASGSGVAVAADGSIYVTGSVYVTGSSDLLLLKYSPAGALLWRRTWNGAANGGDSGRDVAVAADGSVYVTGSFWAIGGVAVPHETGFTEGSSDRLLREQPPATVPEARRPRRWALGNLLLRKYSPTGAVLWTKTYNGAFDEYDSGSGVAVAADGSIYVTGTTYVASGSPALLLRKYSPGGALLWTMTYNRILSYGNGVAVGADGGIYVTGSVYVPGQSSENLLLLKYSPGGDALWAKTYNRGLDWGSGVAVAADGGVYVAGSSKVPGQVLDVLLQKYSPAGALLWTKIYNGLGSNYDWGWGVAVAADGGIYVTGSTIVRRSQREDLLLQKYR